MSIRGEIHLDGDRCAGCFALLAPNAELSRVVRSGTVDVLALCKECNTPNWIVWEAEWEAS